MQGFCEAVMDLFNTVATVLTAITAVVGVTIALMQLRASRRDAQESRLADLSWQIYLAYEMPEIREARRAMARVARTQPVPQTGNEYGARYVLNKEAADTNHPVRRMLRFYHQIGILLEKHMIDPDFVFPLVGSGLETSEQGIKAATDWYQQHWAGETGNEMGARRIDVYANAPRLCNDYSIWKQKYEHKHRDRRFSPISTFRSLANRHKNDKKALISNGAPSTGTDGRSLRQAKSRRIFRRRSK